MIVLVVVLSVDSGKKRLIFKPKPKNLVGLAVVNVRAVKNVPKLHENFYKIIFRLDIR